MKTFILRIIAIFGISALFAVNNALAWGAVVDVEINVVDAQTITIHRANSTYVGRTYSANQPTEAAARESALQECRNEIEKSTGGIQGTGPEGDVITSSCNVLTVFNGTTENPTCFSTYAGVIILSRDERELVGLLAEYAGYGETVAEARNEARMACEAIGNVIAPGCVYIGQTTPSIRFDFDITFSHGTFAGFVLDYNGELRESCDTGSTSPPPVNPPPVNPPTLNDCSADGIRGTIRNADDSACVCPAGQEVLNDNGFRACANPIPVPPAFTAGNCLSTGWLWEYLRDPNGNWMQCCLIPARVDNSAQSALSSQSALRPQQVNAGDSVDACVMGQHSGFDTAAAGATDIPRCDEANLFNGGFPERPQAFNRNDTGGNRDRLVIIPAATNTPKAITWTPAGATMAMTVQQLPQGGNYSTDDSSSSDGGGGSSGGVAIAVGAIAVIGIAAWALSDGDTEAFNFTPNYTFSHSNGIAVYSYGSRVDFQKDNVSAFWGVSQTGNGGNIGNLIYSGSMKYAKDFYNLAYKTQTQGETADMNLSANLQWKSGIWQYQSGINAEYRLTETADDFAAGWSNSIDLHYHGWQISPAVNSYWRQNNAKTDLRLNIRREF